MVEAAPTEDGLTKNVQRKGRLECAAFAGN
jgi:hypothetical protein